MPLASTVWPNILFAGQYSARFMHKPANNLWTACTHILRYLKQTKSMKIVCHSSNEIELQVFLVADWRHEKTQSDINQQIHIYTF